MIMPVITVRQPMATWIVDGIQKIEARSHMWFNSLVGQRVLIHVGNRIDLYVKDRPYITDEMLRVKPLELPRGCIIGSVVVDGARFLGADDEHLAFTDCQSKVRYGLLLSNPDKFMEPIFVPGSIGIWHFDIETKQKIHDEV